MNSVGLGLPGVVIVLVIGVVSLASLGLIVWAIIDMSGHTAAEFAALGRNKTAWLAYTLVFTFLCGLGWIPALMYLVSVRPKFRRH